MREVRARVPDSVYQELRRESRRSKRPMQEIVADALRSLYFRRTLSRIIDPNDPLYAAFPIVRSKGRRKENVAARHDEFLYGASE